MVKIYARVCDECGKGMDEGYCVGGGDEYYCSEECLHKHITKEEWVELYAEGEGDSYWTTWEDIGEYEYEELVNELNDKELKLLKTIVDEESRSRTSLKEGKK